MLDQPSRSLILLSIGKKSGSRRDRLWPTLQCHLPIKTQLQFRGKWFKPRMSENRNRIIKYHKECNSNSPSPRGLFRLNRGNSFSSNNQPCNRNHNQCSLPYNIPSQ